MYVAVGHPRRRSTQSASVRDWENWGDSSGPSSLLTPTKPPPPHHHLCQSTSPFLPKTFLSFITPAMQMGKVPDRILFRTAYQAAHYTMETQSAPPQSPQQSSYSSSSFIPLGMWPVFVRQAELESAGPGGGSLGGDYLSTH